MVAAYVVVTVLVGLVTFVVASIAGASIGTAFLLYVGTGTASIVLIAALQIILPPVRQASRPVAEGSTRAKAFTNAGGDPQHFAGTLQASTSLSILAVDDDPFILELIPKIAAKSGYERVVTASSGAEALNLIAAAQERFGCILLDIDMPGMEGVELCSRIRTLEAYRDVPIIMLTGKTDAPTLQRAFLAGATDYTTKPFDVIGFGERLRRAELALKSRQPSATEERGVVPTVRIGATLDVEQEPRSTPVSHQPLIGFDELGNYLTRIPVKELPRTSVIAAMLDGFERHAGLMGEAKLGQLQGALSGRIEQAFGSIPHAMAYAGRGAYVAVVTGENPIELSARLAGVRHFLESAGFSSAKLDRGTWTVSVGPAVQPEEDRSDRATKAFAAAVALVTARSVHRTAWSDDGSVVAFKRHSS